MQISVWESKELQVAILALRGMDKTLQAQIRKAIKTVSLGEWKAELSKGASTKLENKVLVDTARVSVSNQNITLSSGAAAKKLRGGAATYQLTPGTEFGSKQHKQFKPTNRKGHVVYPAAAKIIPRIAALWVQTTIRTFYEAFEGGK